MPAVTVFTPTFNRAATLPRVYHSLANQTFTDFEWMIVDDGSTDETSEMVHKWVGKLDIKYFFQPNQGKHIAYNHAIEFASGKYFINLDSDDSCTERALEIFVREMERLPEGFDGVTVLCMNDDFSVSGEHFPVSPLDCSALDLRHIYKVKGEKWGMKFTNVIRQYRFPVLSEVSHVPENVIWDTIAKKYKTRFINERLRIYHKGQDQITGPRVTRRSALAFAYGNEHGLVNNLEYFLKNPCYFIKSAINYTRYMLTCGKNPLLIIKNIHFSSAFLILVTAPIGVALWVKDRCKALSIAKQ